MAWIRTVAEDEADGHLAKIYREAIARAGKVFGILKVQSLDARILDASMRLYMATTTHPRLAASGARVLVMVAPALKRAMSIPSNASGQASSMV